MYVDNAVRWKFNLYGLVQAHIDIEKGTVSSSFFSFKIVVLATLPQQNISKYKTLYDQHIKLTDTLLQKCQPS